MPNSTKEEALPQITILVHCEWPTGEKTVEIEVDATATDAEIHEAASDAFFNLCNFGWERANG